MVRHLVKIAFGTLLALTASAEILNAQGRGRANRALPSRPAFVARVSPPVFLPGVAGRVRILGPQPIVIFSQPFGGYYSPYVFAPPVYAMPAPVYTMPAHVAPAPSQTELELVYQVQRLSQEIQQLRQEQAAAAGAASRPLVPSPARAPLPQAPVPPATPTILVFRDGRRLSIQNYAIVGPTLWILDEEKSTKILLADLDLEATHNENRGVGTRFPLIQR